MKRLVFDVAFFLVISGVLAWTLIPHHARPVEVVFASPGDAGAYGIEKYANDSGGELDGKPRLLWIRDQGGGRYSAKYLVTPQGLGPETYIVTMIRSEWQIADVQPSGSP